MVELPGGEKKTLKIRLTVYTQYRRVTDGTDGQTDILPRHSPRYAYASRGKKISIRYDTVYLPCSKKPSVASLVHYTKQTEQELSYRKQIARQLRTQYAEALNGTI